MRLDGADPFITPNTTAGTPCAAASYLPSISPEMVGVDREVTNAAVVVLRAETGEILSMVGSIDFWNEGIQGNYNAALAQRQPASAFKPIVYTAAFLQGPLPGYPNGITAATMTYDVAIEFNNGGQPYTPVNIDRQYHGPVSVRDALANSYNVPPVQLVNLIGVGPVIRTAHRLGIGSLNQASQYGLALALGSAETSLLDLTYVYNVFNTGGYMIGMPVHKDEETPGLRTLNPAAVLRIEDADGRVLWQYSDETVTFQRRLILEPALAYIMTDILADNKAREAAFGPGSVMEISRPAAVKTGTSNDNRDSWTVGYTPQIVTGVWMGNNNNHSMNDVTGESGAAAVWHAIMEYVHIRDSLPRQEWAQPSTVIERVVCQTSGLLPHPVLSTRCANCFWSIRHWASIRSRSNPIPTGITIRSTSAPGDWRRLLRRQNAWKTWSFLIIRRRHAPGHGTPGKRLPPTEYDVADVGSPFSPVAIVSPPFLARVRGAIEVRGNATGDDFAYYRLDYGAGTQPDVWLQIGEQSSEPGRDLVLGTWDTVGLSDGAVYTLRLTMVHTDNTPETSYVSVTVDNLPPQIVLAEPITGSEYHLGQDVYVPLQATPEDNVQMAYVEFYRDGELITTSEVWPYSARWEITEVGEYTFWAVAYDAAGNSAESERVSVRVVEP